MKKPHMTKAQIIRACILLPLIIAFCCYMISNYYKYPQVEIWPTANRMNSTVIPLKDNYMFDSNNPYVIEQTTNGYDIIIHIINKE